MKGTYRSLWNERRAFDIWSRGSENRGADHGGGHIQRLCLDMIWDDRNS